MEDGDSVSSGCTSNMNEKMGAANINTAARKAILEERKKQIEEKLSQSNNELKELCIQEAELTGVTPPEMPLDYAGTPQRKMGTAFQFDENLLNNNDSKDKMIADLELEIQLHKYKRDAALGLSNDGTTSKTVKRHHRLEYQKYKEQVKVLEAKLAALKEKASEQTKQKKKTKVPEPQDDTVSIMTSDAFVKHDTLQRQFVGNYNLNMLSPTDTYPEAKYTVSPSKQLPYNRNSENVDFYYAKTDEALVPGFYRLSLNGYSNYIESQENVTKAPHYKYPMPNMRYNQPQYQMYPQQSSSAASILLNSPTTSQHRPISAQIPQYYPHHSPQSSPISPHSPNIQRTSQTFPKINQQYLLKQHSPTTKVQYYPAHTIHGGDPGYSRYSIEACGVEGNGTLRNIHPLQPHQQYDSNGMATTSGLGGCWKKSENGELFWVYSSNTIDGSWQRDKRFGSLDRRKNKRVTRRISPVDSKSATLATVPTNIDQVKTAFVKQSQTMNRKSQDHRHLVRTQSLGSVGQTVDNIYYSDDTSSCESDNRSFKDTKSQIRKQKEKEWLETSLDGPMSPTSPTRQLEEKISFSSPPRTPNQKIFNRNCSPVVHPPRPSPPPPLLSPKPPLEIPAESNPSPRVPEPPNMELLNNNILKNCTIVQAGAVKPYHEETKPFEMSDFYKYSTKFKKSPQKDNNNSQSTSATRISQKNLTDNFEQSTRNFNRSSNQQYVVHQSVRDSSNPVTANNSLDLGQIAVSERFSEEMNAWYQDQEHPGNTATSKGHSGATLV